MKQSMKLIFLLALLVPLFGCQRYGRKLFGVEEREKQVGIPLEPDVTIVELADQSDPDFFRVLVMGWEDARYTSVWVGDGVSAWVPLPVTNPHTGIQALVIKDRGMFTFSNVLKAVPVATQVKIEMVK